MDVEELYRMRAAHERIIADIAPEAIEGALQKIYLAHQKTLTVLELACFYQTDPRSAYQRINRNSRAWYDCMIKRIIEDCGNDRVADLTFPRLKELHALWLASGGSTAKAEKTMLRGLLSFGETVMEGGPKDGVLPCELAATRVALLPRLLSD